MRRHRPLQLILALRLYGGSGDEICERAEALLESLEASPPERSPPIHWNFAAASLLESPSRRMHNLIVEIKARLASRGDGILPAGFAGAVHSRLEDEELRRELTWCFRNPWFSGLKAVFGLQPTAVLPFAADPLREVASGRYSAVGYRLLALPLALGSGRLGQSRGLTEAARLFSLGVERASMLPAVVIRTTAEAGLLARLAAPLVGPAARLLVLLDPQTGERSGDAAELMHRLLDGLAQGHSLRFPRLEELCAEPPTGGAPPLSSFALAAGRIAEEPEPASRARAARLRSARRPSSAEQRAVLESLRALPAPGSSPGGSAAVSRLKQRAAGRRRAETVMSASMSGLVTLSGPRYDATFAEGRLSGFSAAGRQMLGGAAARSFLCLGARTLALQTESAFSFERDAERGVHTELTAALDSPGSRVRLHMDSYFRDGEEPLTIEMSAELSDPGEAGRLTALVPLELPLAVPAGDRAVFLQAELPGGGLYRESLTAPEGLLYGRQLQVALGEAILLIESPDGLACVQYRLQKARRRLLLLNLGGTYTLQPGCAAPLLSGPVALRVGLAPG